MREDAQEKLTYLKSHPAPQFYHVFRPLLDISAKNPTRIKLAQKAILINMSQHKESWDQAAARFVQKSSKILLVQNTPARSIKTALKIKRQSQNGLLHPYAGSEECKSRLASL